MPVPCRRSASRVPRLALAAVLAAVAPAAPAGADDAFEPNDALAIARELALGTYAASGEDPDWYVVRDVGPGTLYVDFQASPGTVRAFLWAEGATPLGANGPCDPARGCMWADPKDLVFQRTGAGDYYFQVSVAGGPGGYTFTLQDRVSVPGDDAYDAGPGNDSVARASPVPSTAQLGGLRLLDLDYYEVDVLPGVFTVGVAPAAGILDLELYDDAGAPLCSWLVQSQPGQRAHCAANRCPCQATEVPLELRFEVRQARALRIGVVPDRIFTPDASGPTYALSTDLPTRWIATLPYGPVRDGSIALADLDRDGREEVLVPTSKGLDAALDEVREARLVCLDGVDGHVRWATPFPAIAGADPFTCRAAACTGGCKTYATTSVSSTPVVGDVDGDGELEVVVGVGADLGGEAEAACGAAPSEVPGQPGDMGGVWAVDAATGDTEWFHPSYDQIGGPTNTGDGRPDGVFSTPRLADVDGVPGLEVIYGGWDRHVWVLDGKTGQPKPGWPRLVFDTVFSSPAVADLDGDGRREILIGTDITANPAAGTSDGGIFHVFRADGSETVPGFDRRVNGGVPAAVPIYGMGEPQVLTSSPAVADFDGDGQLEIAYGTGTLLPGQGHFVRVWNHDASWYSPPLPPPYVLPTDAPTPASVVFADLEGDGPVELIGADMAGVLHAWRSDGSPLWETATEPWCPGGGCPLGIIGSPLAVDLDGDGDLEVLFSQGFQVVVVDTDGRQISSTEFPYLVMGAFRGSPAVGEIDGDGVLDIVSAGSQLYSNGAEQTTVLAWRWEQASAPLGRFARRQFAPEPAAPALAGAALLALALVARRGALWHRRRPCSAPPTSSGPRSRWRASSSGPRAR